MNSVREREYFDFCPLVEREMNIGECYDVQMVASHLIKERVLDFVLDRDKAGELCPVCPYNQLYDTTEKLSVSS